MQKERGCNKEFSFTAFTMKVEAEYNADSDKLWYKKYKFEITLIITLLNSAHTQ